MKFIKPRIFSLNDARDELKGNVMSMDYATYLQQLRFRFRPTNPVIWAMAMTLAWLQGTTYQWHVTMRRAFWLRWHHRFRRAQQWLEMTNTTLPEDNAAMRERLRESLNIPRMSTFTIGAVLNQAVARMKADECFVNVGVWHGFTFLAALKDQPEKRCIGIDNFSQWSGPEDGNPQQQFLARFQQYKSPRHEFYNMDYRDYFAKIHQQKIGVYMYDGHHSYEHQFEGLRVAEPFFSKECIVIVDDTNWDAPHQATLDFIKQSSSQYRILLDQRTYKHSHPTLWCGLMIVQRIA